MMDEKFWNTHIELLTDNSVFLHVFDALHLIQV